MSYQKLFDTKISGEAVNAWKSQGKKAIGYVCCHIPEEIIYAADVFPVHLRATDCVDSSDAEAWMSSFSCSYARSILQYLMNGTYDLDGLAQAQGCMMQARITDNFEHIQKKKGKKIFAKFVGAPRMSDPETIAFYKSELQELADALGELSGHKVTDEGLKAAIAKANETRKLIAELYDLRKAENPVVSGTEVLSICLAHCDIHVDDFNAMLKEFLADAKNRKPIVGRARLMVIGSALDDPEYLKVIENAGGIIVSDYNCFGDRTFGPEMKIDDSDVMGSIAAYYMARNTCPRELDNRPEIHKEIVDLCKENGVQGVIYQKMQNCECWGGESYYLEPDLKAIGVPMLQLEREEHMANAGQLSIRAEAFIEMLER
ncbi:MAG: 2-hydroxyacyl-CoA dehydratase family protein [Oscillospiraceae bacterium]